MILTDNDLIDLINKTYDNVIINKDKFDSIVVKVDNKEYCSFYFRYFDKEIESDSVAERFIGHTCLAFERVRGKGESIEGYGYMEVADNKDLSQEIIDFISKGINPKLKTYQQLTLF